MGILDGLPFGQDQLGWLGALLQGNPGVLAANAGVAGANQAPTREATSGMPPIDYMALAQLRAPNGAFRGATDQIAQQPSPPSLSPMVAPQAMPPDQSGGDAIGRGAAPIGAPATNGANPFSALFSGLGGLLPGNGQPQGAQAPSPPGPGVMDRLTAGATNFTTGGNPLAGIFNSIHGLMTGQRTDPAGVQQQQVLSTYHALVGAGIPPAVAQAAALNPKIMETIAPQLYSKPQVEKIKDAFGNERVVFANPDRQTVTEPGAAASPGSPAAPGTSGASFLAPGVRQVDSSLSGDAYLQQFSPEVQAAVKSYMDGRAMPTGNPRQGFVQTVKMIAQKYGQDVGIPTDDTTYNARAQMRKNLSTAAPNSLGGQINIGNTAIGHLQDLSQKAIGLGNWDIGIAPLSHAINDVRGLTSAQSAKIEALRGAAQHYGQEITKFYAGSPGGEGERNRFLSAVDGAKTPQELASVIETEAELMHSRLQALGSQIQGTLGDRGSAEYPVLRPESAKALTQISANASQLRGGAPSPQQQAPLTAQDQQAIAWARANPSDPRAAKIMQMHGAQ